MTKEEGGNIYATEKEIQNIQYLGCLMEITGQRSFAIPKKEFQRDLSWMEIP